MKKRELTEQGVVERDATRAELLERLHKLWKDAGIHNEADLELDLEQVLDHYERRWKIKVAD